MRALTMKKNLINDGVVVKYRDSWYEKYGIILEYNKLKHQYLVFWGVGEKTLWELPNEITTA